MENATPQKPVVNLWANFLAYDKLEPKKVGPQNAMKLVDLCCRLAAIGRPAFRPYAARLKSRQLVVDTAMDAGIDLAGMKKPNGKPAIGRGLLDAWNKQYLKRFGDTFGTGGEAERKRRDMVTRMSKGR